MLKFDEQKQLNSVNGALALRPQIEQVVDEIQERGFDGIYFIGIGGTWASAMQVEVYMRGKSSIPVFVENAAEFITTGNKRFTEKSIVIFSSVTGSTLEMVKAVEKAHEIGAKVFRILRVSLLLDAIRYMLVVIVGFGLCPILFKKCKL